MKHELLSLAISSILIFGAGSIFAQNNNVLIEVGASCGCIFCPCADITLHGIQNNYPGVMILQYHWNIAPDPFGNFNGNNIVGMLGLNTIPAAVFGRRTGPIVCSFGGCFSNWTNQVTNQTNNIQPGVSINLVKSYNSGTRELQITANVTASRQIDTACYINFVITENGIIFFQSGTSNCPGSNEYVHYWVVRNMVNNASGELISTGTWQQGITLTKSWTTILPWGWVDANCTANIFVYMQGSPLNSNAYVLQTKKQSVTAPTGISNNNEIPTLYSLSQNYPNPFNPTTNIKFSLPKEGYVSLKIYDMTGALVQTYVDGSLKAGTYNAEVDGSNLSSGVYFYTLLAHEVSGSSTGDFVETKKMVLIK